MTKKRRNRPNTDRPRTTRDVIDQAIYENRTGEWLLYGFAFIFVAVGLTILIWALKKGQPVIALLGFTTSSLFWPALNSIRKTRRENLAIRLLEEPLARADTAKEAADSLSRFFEGSMQVSQDGQPVETRPSQKQVKIQESQNSKAASAE